MRHGRTAEENPMGNQRDMRGPQHDLRRLLVAPGNGRKGHPGRSARTRWTEGAQARTVGRASAQGGLARGQHRGRQ